MKKRGIPLNYPQLDNLGVDSAIDLDMSVDQKTAILIRNNIQYLQRTRGRKYATKTMNEGKSLRVWRLS